MSYFANICFVFGKLLNRVLADLMHSVHRIQDAREDQHGYQLLKNLTIHASFMNCATDNTPPSFFFYTKQSFCTRKHSLLYMTTQSHFSFHWFFVTLRLAININLIYNRFKLHPSINWPNSKLFLFSDTWRITCIFIDVNVRPFVRYVVLLFLDHFRDGLIH